MAPERKQFKTIDEYIRMFPDNVRVLLEQVRLAVRRAAPEAVETISYRMPAFKLDGKVLVFFAAWEKHIGFYPTPSGTRAFDRELSHYKRAKGSIQFPMNEPMPLDLIERIVRFRAEEIAGKKTG